ncbi:MAG: sigma-70 family RNA polymerase sigma factor [Oscillospiraceae bacterium]|nr:sigma-70 family RNA polymerase sigma factor [Oscillospiraceae bacterium]
MESALYAGGRAGACGALRRMLAAIRALPAAVARFLAAELPAAGTAARAALDRAAEEALDDYGDSILRLAYSYLHNAEDAEEVLQDTLIRFIRTAPQLDGEAHKKAWLLHVAANISKNRIGYNRVRSADELNEELVSQERDDLSFVWEAVRSLPVKYREVVHLFYCEGYRTAEIASILHENEATVRSRLSRGRERLRAVLKEAYDFA